MQPKISVIIPVHNVEPYIDRCVMSVRNQTLQDIEIILVENLSTDNSLKKCREHEAADPRVKVLVLDVAGPSSARNAGVKAATAPYIGFIDSDDWIDPETYETLLGAAKRHNVEMAYCNYRLDYEDGSFKSVFPDTGKTTPVDIPQLQRDIILERSTSSPCVRIYPREFFDTRQFPVGKFYEDHATMYRWIGCYKRAVYVDIPFYHYFMRKGSTCHSYSTDTGKIIDLFNAEYERLEYIEQHGIFTDPDELREARTHIIKQSISHLKTYISAIGRSNFNDAELKRMRHNLLKCLSYSRKEIKPRTYNKLRRIAYIWPIYFLLHSKSN